MRTRSRRLVVTSLVVGMLVSLSGTAAMAADSPDDPYCDVVLPVLYKVGYNGEDPRCTA